MSRATVYAVLAAFILLTVQCTTGEGTYRCHSDVRMSRMPFTCAMVLLSPDVAGSILTGTGLLTEGSYPATRLVINLSAEPTHVASSAITYPRQADRSVVQHSVGDRAAQPIAFRVEDRAHAVEDDPIEIPVNLPGHNGVQHAQSDDPVQIPVPRPSDNGIVKSPVSLRSGYHQPIYPG